MPAVATREAATAPKRRTAPHAQAAVTPTPTPGSPDDPAPPVRGPDRASEPFPRTIGRFEVEEELGRGGTARVFAVRDPADGSRRALKLLHAVGPEDTIRARFRREFRALSRLSHPNVLAVQEWGIDRERPWFTMEWVDGRVLRDAIGDLREMESAQRHALIRDLVVQIARALDYVHDRGLVHRDVSPGNVMLRDDGLVKLMDFGLVSGQDAELTVEGEVVGTIAYAAPEQLQGRPLDARADLYALGALLFHMLTGRPPFRAHTVQGYLACHAHESPRPPRDLDPLVPELLERVCLRLLAKAPADRFASARHLLHVLGEDGPTPPPGDPLVPHVVGRRATRAWMSRALEEVAAGRRGGALRLRGASGVGKSRVLDLAEEQADRLGLRVVRGRCQGPEQLFGGYREVWSALRGPDAPPILEVFFEGRPDASIERYAILRAFQDLLDARAPLVVVLDAFHAADAGTRELTEYLIRNTLELADRPVAFLVAEDADGGPDDRGLGRLRAVETHDLGPLDPTEVEELLTGMLQDEDLATALAARLHRETQGNTAWLVDMLHGLADDGTLALEDGRWRWTADAGPLDRRELPLPDGLRATLLDRLEPLSEDARRVGRLVALARDDLDLDLLVELAPVDEDRVMEALDELAAAGITVERRVDDVDRVGLSHDRFRDVLVDELDETERRRLHASLAERLERRHRRDPSRVLDALAHHYEHGGLPARAYAWLARAAHDHVAAGLPDAALRAVERALALEPTARTHLPLIEADARLARLLFDQAMACWSLSRWDDALAAAERARRLASEVHDPALSSAIETALGKLHRNRSELEAAEQHLLAAVTHAHVADDARLLPEPLYHLAALDWARGELDSAERRWTRSRTLAEEVGDRAAQAHADNGLGILAFCRGRPDEARRLLERSAASYVAVGDVADLAVTRVNLVETHLATGALRRAWQLSETTVRESRIAGHDHGIALGLVWRARLLLVLGRPEEARETSLESMRLARRIGTLDEQVAALGVLVEALLQLDLAASALQRLRRLEELLRGADHERASAQVRALQVQALVACDRHAEAREVLAQPLQAPTFPHVQARTALDLGRALAGIGRLDDARARAREALDIAESCGFRFYALLAHHALAELVTDDTAHQHAARARSLARTLASSLPTTDQRTFLRRGWGEARGDDATEGPGSG